MTDKTGGPAFPANHFDLAKSEHGMTQRDYFAAKAMQGLLAHPRHSQGSDEHMFARDAYKLADAMLKERDK